MAGAVRRGLAWQGLAGLGMAEAWQARMKGGEKMIYKWKRNFPANAQATGEFLDSIARRDGGIFPAVVVSESRDKDAVLHKCFEWDDDIAAEKYREGQARSLIKNLITINVVRGEEKSVPSFVSVTVVQEDDEDGRRYVSIETAMNNSTMREQVLQDAMRELNSFRKKYNELQELSSIFREIERLMENEPA